MKYKKIMDDSDSRSNDSLNILEISAAQQKVRAQTIDVHKQAPLQNPNIIQPS